MHDVQALGRELQALRREVRRQRRSQRRAFLVAVVAVVLAAASPIAVFAASFTDLNQGSVHNANINAIADAGITAGCQPPNSYCPNDNVTREELASFLARTAGLGGNPPVVNAKTAQTAQTATNATNATNAQNAVNAQNATNAQNAVNAQTATTATTATNAGNATTLQGLAPNALLRTNFAGSESNVYRLDETLTPVATVSLSLPGPGYVLVTSNVTLVAGTNGNPATEAAVLIVDNSNATESYPQFAFVGARTGMVGETGLSPTWVFQATEGGQRTFSLMATRNPNSIGRVFALSGAITATYIPFGSGGAAAAGQKTAPPFQWPTPQP